MKSNNWVLVGEGWVHFGYLKMMSYFELRGYIKELGYTTTCTFSIKPPDSGILEDIDNDMDILDLCCSLEDGDIVEIYVKHMIDEAVVDPNLILLKNVSHADKEESGSTFNKGAEPNCGPNIVVGDETLSGEDLFTTTPQTTVATAAKASSTSTPINTTNPSTTNHASTDPDPATANPISIDPTTVDPNDIDVGPVRSDLVEEDGSDYSTEESVDTEGELVRDDDEDYGSDVHEEVRELRAENRTFQRRKRNERVQVDTEEVPVSEAGPDLGFDETETGKISVEGRLGGDEPYYPSSDDYNFEIDEDECCDEDEHNFNADSSDSDWVNLPRRCISTVFRQRILEQPSIRVLKLQDLIRKKLKVHVGKTTVRRARAKVLKAIMGDHIVEFGRILDYKDELLRTNPGTTCVVKLDEPDAHVVEYENKNTWTWFVNLLKTDLGLGDGGDVTLITDMQKLTGLRTGEASKEDNNYGGLPKGVCKYLEVQFLSNGFEGELVAVGYGN
ncbi:hypothetical protein KY290_021581 [Solanum tuberosum]|uniref:Uncharacterized protein n=1 Tax=Solanum tuberosum TaxID=4113 RepID=A0ABQ7V1Z2_SOLTU|nr:hypothetical protein KY290_021581 [Solanum tuberosum]